LLLCDQAPPIREVRREFIVADRIELNPDLAAHSDLPRPVVRFGSGFESTWLARRAHAADLFAGGIGLP